MTWPELKEKWEDQNISRKACKIIFNDRDTTWEKRMEKIDKGFQMFLGACPWLYFSALAILFTVLCVTYVST